MKRLGRALDRGLCIVWIVWRDWLYWRAFAWFVVLVAVVFGLGTAIWVTVEEYTAHDWHVFGVYALSEFLLFLPFAPDKTKKIRDLDGEVLVWTIDAITRHSGILDLRDRMLGEALGAGLWGGGTGAGLLIGIVVVLRIVRWRNSRRRLRGTGEKRAVLSPRRWIVRRVNSVLCILPVSVPVRFVRKAITQYAVAGSTEREDAKPAAGKHHTADSAEAPGKARLRSDQRSNGEAPNSPSGTPTPATSPSAPRESARAVLDASANPNRFEPTSRMPHIPGQVSCGVRTAKSEDGGPPGASPSREHRDAARDDGADKGPSPAPQGERDTSADRMPGSNDRPLPAAIRHGHGRRRRRASQDFY